MGRLPGKTEQITLQDFTPEFFKKLTHGQIIGFTQPDGSLKHWRVSKIWHKRCQAWLQPWELFEPGEMNKLEEARKNG